MAIITKISTQAKNIDRCNLYLDGTFYAGVSKFVILQNHIKENQEIDEENLNKLIFESDKDQAFNWAVDYVCKYLPVEKQLRKKLYDKGYSKQIVAYVIEKCKCYGYIDDYQFALSYVDQNKFIKGKLKIKAELIQKGINEDTVDKALDNYEENDGCLILAQKKAKNMDLEDPKKLASLMRFLQYRGYNYEEINRAISSLKDNYD